MCLKERAYVDDREGPMVFGRHCVRSIPKTTTTTTATTATTTTAAAAATINPNCNKKQCQHGHEVQDSRSSDKQ